MTDDQTNHQVKATGAQAHGSTARGRFDVTDDESSLVVRNPAADGSPARSNTQVRTYTINS